MKPLKTLALVLLSILFVACAVLLEGNLALGGTVFSSSYFSGTVDRSMRGDSIETFASDVQAHPEALFPDADKQTLAIVSDIAKTGWLQEELPQLLKESYAFLVAGEGSLPAVEIKKLKDTLVDDLVVQALANSGNGAQQFRAFMDQISQLSGGLVKNGKANSVAVDAMTQQSSLFFNLKISRTTAQNIVLKAGNSKAEGTSDEDLFRYAVGQVAQDSLGTSKMKSTLDLNALARNAFGSEENPVSQFGPTFAGMRGDLMLMTLLVTLLLLALIAVIAFKATEICRWVGSLFVISGALGLMLPVLWLLNSAQLGRSIMLGLGQPNMTFVRDLVLSFLGGAALSLAIIGAVVAAAGVGLLLLARVLGKKTPAAAKDKPKAALPRVIAAVVLCAAIPFAVIACGRGMSAKANAYNTVVQASDRRAESIGFAQALDKTLGTSVFAKMGGSN